MYVVEEGSNKLTLQSKRLMLGEHRPSYGGIGSHTLRKHAPMIYSNFFSGQKSIIFRGFFFIFLIFAQNIDCGYTLEPPRRGGSNEYPQYMFWSKHKKNRYTPAHPSFTI